MPERRDLNLDLLLEPPLPIRATMDDTKLHELAEDIKRHGVLQNLVVVTSNGQYEVVAGHRRQLAARLAGLVKVPCLIFEELGEAKYAVMLAENGYREDVTAAEEGMLFLDLAEKHQWSEPDLCKHFHKSAEYINERVRLVSKFPAATKHVLAREMNWSQARAIMKCKSPAWVGYLIDQAVTHGATARTIHQYIDQFRAAELAAAGQPPPHTAESAPMVIEVEKQQCVWCQRKDDQINVTMLPCHSYHVKDLVEFLKASGIGLRAAASQDSDKPLA
jgi:ParB family chromosome partitioning protein